MSGTVSTTPVYNALSPGVYGLEIDTTQQTAGIATSTGAMVGATRRGPLGPQQYINYANFVALNGPSDVSWSFVHISAAAFLSQADNLWFSRVVNTDCTYSSILLENDTSGVNSNGSRLLPSLVGVNTDYTEGSAQSQHITFSAPLITANSVAVTLSYPTGINTGTLPATVTLTQVFNTDNDTTLGLLAAQINSYLATATANGFTGYARVLLETTVGNARSIQVVAPFGFQLQIAAVVTLGSSQATVTIGSTQVLYISAQNPGAWANAIGVYISNINIGTSDRVNLTFSTALLTGDEFTANFVVSGNAVTIAPVTFITDNDTTLTAIATAIKQELGGMADCFVTHINGSQANDRVITIVSPNDGPNTLNVVSATIVGTSNATITASKVFTGVSATDTFQLQVVSNATPNTPLETFLVSLKHQLDGYGYSQFIEDVINVGTGNGAASNYIRVSYTGAADNPAGQLTLGKLPSTPVYMQGGNDGSLPTNSQITTAWQAFSDPESYDVRLLINAGYTAVVVQQEMDSIANARQDCFAVLDMPSSLQTTQNASTYRTTTLNINSSYSSLYSPDIQITDLTTDKLIYVPPSGYVAGQFAYTDKNFATWFANAGLTRGLLKNVQGLRVNYLKGDRDILSPVQVNCLRQFRNGQGIAIWDINTLLTEPSLLQQNSVRRLFIYTETIIKNTLLYNVFDPISPQTEFLIKQAIDKFLKPIQDAEGITRYLILCDNTNNSPASNDAGVLNVTVFIVPVVAAKVIVLRTVITNSSINFSELLSSGIN